MGTPAEANFSRQEPEANRLGSLSLLASPNILLSYFTFPARTNKKTTKRKQRRKTVIAGSDKLNGAEQLRFVHCFV